jgi:tRNA pseudouridine55 synthase
VSGSRRDPHGIVIVDKPGGMTSHDVVAQARRHFGTRRIGHAGTLDPMATGVLVLLLGEATKLSDVATNEDKTYLAEVRFGRATDSHDAEGQTTEEQALREGALDAAAFEAALEGERQRRQQVPPAVSALKVEGQRAYKLARSGRPPALEARPVQVRALALIELGDDFARVELQVTKGYYVRAFARDLGHALGIPAHLCGLRRVQSGCFRIEEACAWPPAGELLVTPLAQVLPRLVATRQLSASGIERARQGKLLSASDFVDPESAGIPVGDAPTAAVTAWTDAPGTPVALGRREGDTFRVQRGFRADATPPGGVETAVFSASLDP